MAHAQKPDFVFRRNGRVHLNRQGRQFSRLLAAEVCASAVVMLNTPCSEVVWRILATHSTRQFPLHFTSRASPCAIRFQTHSTQNLAPTGIRSPDRPARRQSLYRLFYPAPPSFCSHLLFCVWNLMAHPNARNGKWRGNWRVEWVASTLHTTSERGVTSITLAASSRMNWCPRQFKWTRPFRLKTISGFCACAITFQTHSTCVLELSFCGHDQK